MYRSKIDVGNENEDVDALFAAHLARETNRLAQDMNGMSAEEREQAYFDLHGIPSNSSSSTTTTNSTASSSPDTEGVTGSSAETSDSPRCPQQVAVKWVEFQQEIHRLPDADRQGYDLACELEAAKKQRPQQSPASSSSYSSSYQESYIHNEKLLRAFFQSSQWNCKAAAEQFVAFWAVKLQLFGKDFLLRDIKLSDLDGEELASLGTGFIQLLPGNDRAGRAVFCIYRRLMQPLAVEKQASLPVCSLGGAFSLVEQVVFFVFQGDLSRCLCPHVVLPVVPLVGSLLCLVCFF
jgi:hypothetical protein